MSMQNLFINIREATNADLPTIIQIEGLCFPHGAWKEENILYELNDNPVAHFWVIELSLTDNQDYRVVGFCDYWETFDSATICQIAVHPYLQHKQLGSAMMDEIYNDCFAKKIQTLTLEVRVGNIPAINFYKKHGFEVVTTKPHYYDNGEDAYYMVLKVK